MHIELEIVKLGDIKMVRTYTKWFEAVAQTYLK